MAKRTLIPFGIVLTLILFLVSIPVGATLTPDTASFTLAPGQSATEYKDVDITYPLRVDVLFSFEASDSNLDIIDTLKANRDGIINNLETTGTTQGVDIAYGVSSHTDYSGNYTSCGYDDYYGNNESYMWHEWYLDDYPYQLNLPITDDPLVVIGAIAAVTEGYGFDNPEDSTRVFYESYADPATGWRPGAKRVMIHFSDEVPHDCDLREGIDPAEFAAYPWISYTTTGCDPGRDTVAGTSDDLDLQTVLAGMKANNVMLIECQPSYTYTPFWNYWTGITGGKFVILGEYPHDDVVSTISGATTTSSVSNVHIEAGPGFENWVDSTWSYTGSVEKQFSDVPVTFTVPAGTAPGVYTFKVHVVDDAGVIYGSQDVTITVVNPVRITGISPPNGVTNTIVDIKNLAGSGFVNGIKVNLTRAGYTNISATGVTVVSPTKITCTFNLAGAQPGYWNVTVTNLDGGWDTLINGFQVKESNNNGRK